MPVSEDVNKKGWGLERISSPQGVALIQTRRDLCIGCGACELVCSMKHFSLINRELSGMLKTG
jgi:formate hydrogenlyase subunit 6/NADH:ubiquinone oxidoreductase subunit I